MLILGIETSCDETGAAVIEATDRSQPVRILSNTVASSLKLHAETGGIIPEIAAREQIKYMLPVLTEALDTAGTTLDAIDCIGVTYGPGLIGSLLVGVETAKTLAYIYNKPIIPVNHMYGHIYANWIHRHIDDTSSTDAITFPALALVVSGGHTDLLLLKNHGDITILGGTRDDAAGEAFDKIGRLLGLSYPAGPVISQLAEKGNPSVFVLPRPMIGSGNYEFSFSGLKTAVLNLTKKYTLDFSEGQHSQTLYDLCAGVEEAIVDIIVRKTLKAAEEYSVKTILLGGGVAANTRLQEVLRERAEMQSVPAEIFIPQSSLCTDNAAMIASAAFYMGQKTPWRNVHVDPELYY